MEIPEKQFDLILQKIWVRSEREIPSYSKGCLPLPLYLFFGVPLNECIGIVKRFQEYL